MNKSNKRNSGFRNGIAFLLLLFLFAGAGLAWFGIPFLTENKFGAASESLTKGQNWSYSFQLLINSSNLLSTNGNGNNSEFTIDLGTSVTQIALNLENAGLIPNASAFRSYLIYKGFDNQIQAGNYQIPAMTSPIGIARLILSNVTNEVPFYIYPGWRAEEIAAALPTSGIEVTPEQFMSIIHAPSQLPLPDQLRELKTLEGFLFPGQYTIPRNISSQDLVMIFINQFVAKVNPLLQEYPLDKGLDLVHVVTLASIIQRETFEDSERAAISSVFYNRLAAGMKLETDPTVQYTLGFNSAWGNWWKTPLALSDLQIQSSMNTYVIDGLPEHPISNPDIPSLIAALSPENTPYYYFRARCDGSGLHAFSETFEEHTSKACP